MHNPLDARQLANFCEIANSQSMRQAAKNLNLTTSAVSHSLKRLEEDLGCKLFDRDTRNMSLTYTGQRLLLYADELLNNLTNARQLVNEWSDVSQKTLRIGATSSACQYLIPIALRELKESFPGMNIQIIPGTSYELMERMDDHQIDIAIYPSSLPSYKKNQISIGTDSLHFIVHPMHPWAKAGKANIDEIESQQLIITDTKGYTFDLVDEYFRTYSVNLMPFIEISNEEVIKRLVELDIGIGILPQWMIQREELAGSLKSLPLSRRSLQRPWIITHLESKELSFIETLFIGIAKNVAQNLFSCMIK
jgi:DNA-binding transcriptional LysR family regulator